MKVGDGGQHCNASFMHAGHAGEGNERRAAQEGCLSPRRLVESIGLNLPLPPDQIRVIDSLF